jgi:hypothetical protein
MAYKKSSKKKKATPEPDNDNLDFVRKAIAKYERASIKSGATLLRL